MGLSQFIKYPYIPTNSTLSFGPYIARAFMYALNLTLEHSAFIALFSKEFEGKRVFVVVYSNLSIKNGFSSCVGFVRKDRAC
jgi:hypothetical protein